MQYCRSQISCLAYEKHILNINNIKFYKNIAKNIKQCGWHIAVVSADRAKGSEFKSFCAEFVCFSCACGSFFQVP